MIGSRDGWERDRQGWAGSSGRALVALSLAFAACIGSSSSGGGDQIATATSGSATLGLAGGHVATSDGSVDVFLPYGALSQNIAIKVQKIASPSAGSVGSVFEISPSGTTFARPIVLTFHYRVADLAGADPETLSIATFESGQWRLYPSRTDMGAGTVAADVTHFSPWAIVLPGSGTIVDAGIPPADDAGQPDATAAQDAPSDRSGSAGADGGKAGAGGNGGAGAGGNGGAGGHSGSTGASGNDGGAGGASGKDGGAGGASGSSGASGKDGGASGADGGAAGHDGSSGTSGTAGNDGGADNADA